jgi:protein arginine N-methyltransferase 3
MKHDSGSETFSDWQEDETVEIQGLLTNKIFNSVSSLLETEKTNFNFDLKGIALNCGVVDDISCIMLVNFIRKEVMQYENINESVLQQLTAKINTKEFLKDESNMIPAVKDDPLLYLISEVLIVADDDMDEKWDNTVEKFIFLNKVSADKSQHDTNNSTEVTEILKSLKDNYEDVVIESKSGDSSYFGSYSNLSIHETMLRDYARTHAYEMAILSNSEYVKDKVVLDIGCGTGILCMLAAKAGAKRVIGVDCSDIIYKAKDIVAANGYDDVITLVKGKLEDLELEMINDHEVDIIVSEWMGYGLYFENMFSSVIYARDKYLKSQHQGGGALMPSDAILFIEGFCTNEENDLSDRVSWWKNVHGFDMSELIAPFVSEAQIQDVDIANICTTKCDMHHLDLMTALDDDLDFTAYFEIVCFGICNYLFYI